MNRLTICFETKIAAVLPDRLAPVFHCWKHLNTQFFGIHVSLSSNPVHGCAIVMLSKTRVDEKSTTYVGDQVRLIE